MVLETGVQSQVESYQRLKNGNWCCLAFGLPSTKLTDFIYLVTKCVKDKIIENFVFIYLYVDS